jgi:hypothetical protein
MRSRGAQALGPDGSPLAIKQLSASVGRGLGQGVLDEGVRGRAALDPRSGLLVDVEVSPATARADHEVKGVVRVALTVAELDAGLTRFARRTTIDHFSTRSRAVLSSSGADKSSGRQDDSPRAPNTVIFGRRQVIRPSR